jgi:hypothetical protein
MRRRLLYLPLLIITLISLSAFIKISSGGIIGVTGSPGETTCVNCHSGGGGVTTVSIIAAPAFNANQYTPGQTYTLNILVVNASFSKFGFDCEILTTTNTNAGVMSGAFTGVQFATTGGKKNATHNAPKSGTGSAAFSFVWTAPASGTAKIYVAGNAVDGTGSTGGDKPGNVILTLTPDLVSVKDENSVSGKFVIFPNPTSGELRMQYFVPQDGTIKATIYDLRGQEISIILDEVQSAGIHSINANLPSDLQRGIYMVKLTQNGVQCAQSMLVKQ